MSVCLGGALLACDSERLVGARPESLSLTYAVVPAVAPNGVASAVWDSLEIISGEPQIRGDYVAGIVLVLFDASSSQAARQAAVDSTGGVVVGGRRSFGSDGYYWVRVPNDTTVAGALDAVTILRRQSAVESAIPAEVNALRASYRKPTDGIGYWREWAINPANAQHENFALERIALPMAWGCTIGSTLTNVAVVDRGMDTAGIADLTEAVTYMNAIPYSTSIFDHGVRVASIVGARGNNSTGITGVMWRAGLRLYDMFADPWTPNQTLPDEINGVPVELPDIYAAHLYIAGHDAPIVNWSFNVDWDTTVHVPSINNAEDVARVTYINEVLLNALRRLDAIGHHPLIVVSAGNDGRSAYWGGHTDARAEFPEQVMIVGATNVLDSLATYSNRGTDVDIYAPGAVTMYIGTGALVGKEGTSYAAPLVTGVAGLLKSFDPAVASTDLKDLIIAGSSRTNKRVDGKPFLNAYESLREAAKQPGAPLCGNRVWPKDVFSGAYYLRTDIVAERDSAAAPEVLFTHSSLTPGPLFTFHGGRRIDDFNTGYVFAYDVGSRSWFEDGTIWDSNNAFSDGDDGGAWNSAWGITHDGDSAIIAIPQLQPDGLTPTGSLIIKGATYQSSLQSAGTFSQIANVSIPTNWTSTSYNAPISPDGDVLYIALNRSSGGEYLRIDLDNGSSSNLFLTDTVSSGVWHVNWFAFSEDGREMVTNEMKLDASGVGYVGCAILYRNMDASRRLANDSLAAVGKVLKRIEGAECNTSYGGATITPMLSPLPRRR